MEKCLSKQRNKQSKSVRQMKRVEDVIKGDKTLRWEQVKIRNEIKVIRREY